MNRRPRLFELAIGLAVATVIGCASAPLEGEPLSITERDLKSDSIITHSLSLTINDSLVHAPESRHDAAWSGYPTELVGVIDVVDHDSNTVFVSAPELIVVPPEGYLGWHVFFEADEGPLGFGTRMALLVWSRPVGSDERWTPVEFVDDEEGPSGRLFAKFRELAGPHPEEAYMAPPPDDRCDISFLGGGFGSVDAESLHARRALPSLDRRREFRVVVVPTFNFCEWTERSYDVRIVVQQAHNGWT